MSEEAKLTQEVKNMGGEHADEIIEAVKELAAVDIEIKNALDEIERIADGLPERHNELADKINSLIKKVCEKKPECVKDDSNVKGEREEPEPKKVKVEVHVVKTPPMRPPFGMPLALMALMDFLNS